MKVRRIEIMIIGLGILMFLFFAISGIRVVISQNDEVESMEIYEEFQEELGDSGATDFPSYSDFVERYRMLGIIIIVLGSTAIASGVLGIFMLMNNRRPRNAGIQLLIVGVLIGLLQFPIAIYGCILFVIAGIMALVRKPKHIVSS